MEDWKLIARNNPSLVEHSDKNIVMTMLTHDVKLEGARMLSES